MKSNGEAARGYSLAELLVVVAIIGVLSLVTVPQFISYSHGAKLRSSLRDFTSDIRNCRQRAITKSRQVRIEFASTTTYQFLEKDPSTGNWVAVTMSGSSGNTKTLSSPLTFTGISGFSDPDGDGNLDIVFDTDGTLVASGDVTLASPWDNLAANRMALHLDTTGKITTTATHS